MKANNTASERKQLYKRSVDYRYYRFSFILCIIICSMMFVVIGMFSRSELQNEETEVLLKSFFLLLFILPYLIYVVYWLVYLRKNIQKCEISTIVLDEIEPFWKQMALRGTIMVDGKPVRKSTRAIYTSHVMSGRRVDLFLNKKVTVAYDARRDRIIVIQRFES